MSIKTGVGPWHMWACVRTGQCSSQDKWYRHMGCSCECFFLWHTSPAKVSLPHPLICILNIEASSCSPLAWRHRPQAEKQLPEPDERHITCYSAVYVSVPRAVQHRTRLRQEIGSFTVTFESAEGLQSRNRVPTAGISSGVQCFRACFFFFLCVCVCVCFCRTVFLFAPAF